jgi:hypothetical protein
MIAQREPEVEKQSALERMVAKTARVAQSLIGG